MEFGITGRRALIAGSSSGIGAAIAVALAAEGARIVIHGRDKDRAESVARTIRNAAGEAAIICGDLGDPAAVEAIGHGALAAFGGIDILVNSAGASDHFDPWLDTSVSTWARQYQLSTLYAVRLIQLMVPTMRSNGWGRIINISSSVVYQPSPFGPDYTAAKAALHVASPGLAGALGAQGITVNTVCAGTILTTNTQNVMKDHARTMGLSETGDALERRMATDVWPNPLRRFGRPEEVAAAVCFLASNQAAYISGTTLRVDGGMGSTVN
jgi:NAD(P)-dependent dehydrogenase (short-subunit alcohol dehydrogenase family)